MRGTTSITAFVLAVAISLATSAQAQSLEQATRLGAFLSRSIDDLGQAKRNLLQMTAGLESPESDRAMLIHDSATRAECVYTQLYVTVSILTSMVDGRDQAFVRKFLAVLAKGSIRDSDAAISSINRELAKLQSRAAIAESQKLRDLIQTIRDEIRRVIPVG